MSIHYIEPKASKNKTIALYNFITYNGTFGTHSQLFQNLMTLAEEGSNKKIRSRLDIRKFEFGNKMVDMWNGSLDRCINSTMLKNYKKSDNR